MGREEFIRGLQVPQNKRPQNKRPKRKIKLNQDIKYKRRRFALGVGLTMGLIAASLGIIKQANKDNEEMSLPDTIVDMREPEEVSELTGTNLDEVNLDERNSDDINEEKKVPKMNYNTDEEATKIALRLIADKVSEALGFEETANQRLYTKRVSDGEYQIRFEYNLNGERFTSSLFGWKETKDLLKYYTEIMKGGKNAEAIYNELYYKSIKIDKDGKLSFVDSEEPINEAGWHLDTWEEKDPLSGMYTITKAKLVSEREIGDEGR